MSSYVVVQLVPKDQEALQAYFKIGGDAVKKHGGAAIAGGPGKEVLEDNGAGAPAHVLLSFPDDAAARNWINDPDLSDAHALRQAGAQTTITLLPAM